MRIASSRQPLGVQRLPQGAYIEVDQGGVRWPGQAVLSSLCASAAASTLLFEEIPAARKYAIYVWAPVESGRSRLVGAAAVSLASNLSNSSPPTTTNSIRYFVHCFGNLHPIVGVPLYQRMHEAAFERGQLEYVRRLIGEEAVTPFIQFELLPGSCCSRVDALLLVRHGWQLLSVGKSNEPACRITDPATATWDHRFIGPHAPEVPPSTLFNLELRAPMIPLSTGYLYPAALDTAVSLQPSTPMDNDHLSPKASALTKYNDLIREQRVLIGPSLTAPSRQTGLVPFLVPAMTCKALEYFVCDPTNHGSDIESSRFPVPTLQVGSRSLAGFSLYQNVQAPGGHNERKQANRTFRTRNRADVMALLDSAPGFHALARDVLRILGYHDCNQMQCSSMLCSVHFFCLDASGQVCFGWHSDDTDLNLKSDSKRRRLRSAVIQLGAAGGTAMQMHGFHQFPFEGRGSGAIFHGAALHRSVYCTPPPQHGIWKVTLFFVLPEDITAQQWM